LYQPIAGIESELLDYLGKHRFAGNVRELENNVQRMLFAKTEGDTLTLKDWQAQSRREDGNQERDLMRDAALALWEAIAKRGLSYAEVIREIEKRLLETALECGSQTRKQLAKQMHTSERTLYHKIRAHNLHRQPTPQ